MKIKQMFDRYREIILYLFFGGLTSIITIAIYFAASWGLGLDAWLSTVISWVVAVAFAFAANKFIVFRSKAGAAKEAALFLAARIFSAGVNTGIMFVFVDALEFNELVIFAVAHVIVLVINYLASKLFIFKDKC
ncbi:MAG: GtrA family protein [Defluviitaleaceae bacterium]|nr:GtrA family protein [Defluviitaleaceae bacterium]